MIVIYNEIHFSSQHEVFAHNEIITAVLSASENKFTAIHKALNKALKALNSS